MGKEDQEFQAIVDAEKKAGSTILYVGAVRKLHDSGKGGDARNIVITTNKIEYYKGKKPDRKFLFIDTSEVRRINEPKSNRIEIYFNQETKNPSQIRFESPDVDNIYGIIQSYLCRSFNPDKVAKIGYDSSVSKNFPYSVVTTNFGFNNLLVKVGKSMPLEISNLVYYLLANNITDIAIPPQRPVADYLFTILYAFGFKRNSKSFTFAAEKPAKSIYAEIVKYVAKRDLHYRHLGFSIPSDEHFKDLLDNFDKYAANCFSFINTSLSSDNLKKLNQKLSEKHVRSLCFYNAFLQEDMQYFANEFFNESIAETLLYLAIDHNIYPQLETIAPKLPNIYILSMPAIGVNTGTILTQISNLKMANLRWLNISANICQSFPEKIDIPQLERLDLSFLTFEGAAFTELIKLLQGTTFQNGIRLHINGSFVQEFEFNASKCSNFKGLVIGPNLTPKLIDFVLACKHLEYLSIDFGMKEESKELFDKIIENLPDMSTLRTLVIQNFIVTDIEKFNQLIPKLNFLENLKILNGSLGDAFITALNQLVMESRSIKQVSIDRVNMEQIEPLQKLASDLSTKEEHVLFVPPLADLAELVTKFPNWKGNVQDIKKLLAKARGENLPIYNRILTEEQREEFSSVKEYAQAWDSPLLPINRYDETEPDTIEFRFPQYISKEQMDLWGIEDKYAPVVEEPPKEDLKQNEEEEKKEEAKEEVHEENKEEKSEKSDSKKDEKKSTDSSSSSKKKKVFLSSSSDEDDKQPPKKKISSSSSDDEKPAPKKSVFSSTSSDDELPPPKKKKLSSDSESEEKSPEKKPEPVKESSSSDDELPPPKKEAAPAKKPLISSSSSEDLPPPKKQQPKKLIEDEEEDDELPPPKKQARKSIFSSSSDEDLPPPKKPEPKKKLSSSSSDKEDLPPPKKPEPAKKLSSSSDEEEIPPKKPEPAKKISSSSSSDDLPPPKKPQPVQKLSSSSDEEIPPKKPEPAKKISSSSSEDELPPPKKPQPVQKLSSSSDDELPPPKKPEPKRKLSESSSDEELPPPKKPEPVKKISSSSSEEEDELPPPKKPEPKKAAPAKKISSSSSSEEEKLPPPKKPEPKKALSSSSSDEEELPPPKKQEPAKNVLDSSSSSESDVPPPKKEEPVKKVVEEIVESPPPKKEEPQKKKNFFDSSDDEVVEPVKPPQRKPSPARKPSPVRKPSPAKISSSSSDSDSEKEFPKKISSSSSSSDDEKPVQKSPARQTKIPDRRRSPSPQKFAELAKQTKNFNQQQMESDDPEDVDYSKPDWDFPIVIEPIHTQATTKRIDSKYSIENVLNSLKNT